MMEADKFEQCYKQEEMAVEDIEEGYIKQEIDTILHEKNYSQQHVSNEKSTNTSNECIVVKVEKCEYYNNELQQASAENDLERYSESHESIIVKEEFKYHDEELLGVPVDNVDRPAAVSGDNQDSTDTTRMNANVLYQDIRLIATRQTNKPSSNQKRQSRNLAESQNVKGTKLKTREAFGNTVGHSEDAVHDKISQDAYDMRKKLANSANDTTLVEDKEESEIDLNLQCHVFLEKIYYKCDICGYIAVIKQILESHMELHNVRQFYSDDGCEMFLKNKIQLEKRKLKKTYNKCEVQDEGSSETRRKSEGTLKQLSRSLTDKHSLHACNLCPFKSSWKYSLKQHMLTHTGEKPYACDFCLYKSVHKSALKRHKLTHTGEKPYACDFCSYKSARVTDLKRHLSTHTGEKPYACECCSYKSVDKSALKRHILTHTGEKPYACDFCSYKSARVTDLKRHLSTHTGEKSYACDFCSYKSVGNSDLKQHILTHTGEKPYACDFCSYKSARATDLKRHLSTHTGEKPYACDFCSYKSVRNSDLKQHMLTHTGEKPYACDLCPYKSTQKSNLKLHILTHTGEKPYACDFCSYKSARATDLKRHLSTHSDFCSYKSVRNSDLKQHMLTHTGEKPYSCNLYPYKSARESELKKHIFTHTGEKPYACNLCPFKSSWKLSLKKHILTHIGDKVGKSDLKKHKLTHTGKKTLRLYLVSI